MKKVILPALLSLFLIGAKAPSPDQAELLYDGNLVKKITLPAINEVEHIDLDDVAALVKGKVQWHPVAGKATLGVNNQKISFAIDDAAAWIGKKKITLSAPTQSMKGHLYIPLDFFLTNDFCEASDCRIQWDGAARIFSASPKVSMLSPRILTLANRTLVVLETTEEASPTVQPSSRLIRVFIPRMRVSTGENFKINDAVVKEVRTAQEKRGVTVSIALEKGSPDFKVQQEKNPFRIIVAFPHPRTRTPLKKKKEEGMERIPIPAAKPVPADVAVLSPKSPVPPQTELSLESEEDAEDRGSAAITASSVKKRIVVDPGHGGNDPGAVGKNGTKEKDINLLIALELARTLSIENGYEVYLTRTDDTFIPLSDRTTFANEKQADLFVSIHCNASISRKKSGFEIYFLSENASDEAARAAAELENSVLELEEGNSGKKKKLKNLLTSMARNEFINESSLLCSTVINSVKKRATMDVRGVEQANFYVLRGAQMPAVLAETAYLSNPAEEDKLRTRKFRSSFVDSIVSGIADYWKNLEKL